MGRGLIKDASLLDQLVAERKRLGIDLHDEVWEGMYVMPSMPSNAHQELLDDLSDALTDADCTDEELLDHLARRHGHVKGCWALDAVLGRS